MCNAALVRAFPQALAAPAPVRLGFRLPTISDHFAGFEMKTLLICAAFAAGLQAIDAFAQLPPGDGPATISTTPNEPTPLRRT